MRAKVFVGRVMDLEARRLLLLVWPMSAMCRVGSKQACECEQEVERYTKEWALCHVPGEHRRNNRTSCELVGMVRVYLCKSLF